MRSGLNGRRINRLAVNATYREIVHAESTATLVVDYVEALAVMDAIMPDALAMVIGDDTAGSGDVSPGSEGIASIALLMPSEPTVSPGSEGTAVIGVPMLTEGNVYDGGDTTATAEIGLAILSEPAVLPIVESAATLAVLDFETMVSPLATPAIPAEYVAPPRHRSISMWSRDSMAVEADRREFEVAEIARKISVKRKRRLKS